MLTIDWDDPTNMQKVRDTVSLLLKGCSCKKGCGSKRCGCLRSGKKCGPGCNCSNCVNTSTTVPASGHLQLDDIELDEICSSENLALQAEESDGSSENLALQAEESDGSDELEDESGEEIEYEVVCDNMESDYVIDL